jgi:hypothetical protein
MHRGECLDRAMSSADAAANARRTATPTNSFASTVAASLRWNVSEPTSDVRYQLRQRDRYRVPYGVRYRPLGQRSVTDSYR